MPTHWTYDEFKADEDLKQGDILAPTEDLRRLFREVHPHFCDEKYLAFVVITQSCDLAIRDEECSARYINVAVVRSLSDVLRSLLDTVCEPLHEGIYSEREKNRAWNLLERIFNQNEQKLGLFYLFPDGDVEIGEDAIAFLRVSVAFRVEHYHVMRLARCGRLRPEFANKLGWLVGNMYARIGTPVWTKENLTKMIQLHVGSDDPGGIRWLRDDVAKHIVKDLKKEGRTPTQLPRDELLSLAESKIPRPKDVGIEQVLAVAKDVFKDIDEQALERFRRRLRNNNALTAAFRS